MAQLNPSFILDTNDIDSFEQIQLENDTQLARENLLMHKAYKEPSDEDLIKNNCSSFTFVDFCPKIKRLSSSSINHHNHHASGGSLLDSLETFSDLFDRINVWLQLNEEWRVKSAETLIYDESTQFNHLRTSFNGYSLRQTIRGVRLWLVPAKNRFSPAQKIGCINVVPRARSSLQSNSKFNEKQSDNNDNRSPYEDLDEILKRLNDLLINRPIEGRILSVETITLPIVYGNVDTETNHWSAAPQPPQVSSNAMGLSNCPTSEHHLQASHLIQKTDMIDVLRVYYEFGPFRCGLVKLIDFVPYSVSPLAPIPHHNHLHPHHLQQVAESPPSSLIPPFADKEKEKEKEKEKFDATTAPLNVVRLPNFESLTSLIKRSVDWFNENQYNLANNCGSNHYFGYSFDEARFCNIQIRQKPLKDVWLSDPNRLGAEQTPTANNCSHDHDELLNEIIASKFNTRHMFYASHTPYTQPQPQPQPQTQAQSANSSSSSSSSSPSVAAGGAPVAAGDSSQVSQTILISNRKTSQVSSSCSSKPSVERSRRKSSPLAPLTSLFASITHPYQNHHHHQHHSQSSVTSNNNQTHSVSSPQSAPSTSSSTASSPDQQGKSINTTIKKGGSHSPGFMDMEPGSTNLSYEPQVTTVNPSSTTTQREQKRRSSLDYGITNSLASVNENSNSKGPSLNTTNTTNHCGTCTYQLKFVRLAYVLPIKTSEHHHHNQYVTSSMATTRSVSTNEDNPQAPSSSSFSTDYPANNISSDHDDDDNHLLQQQTIEGDPINLNDSVGPLQDKKMLDNRHHNHHHQNNRADGSSDNDSPSHALHFSFEIIKSDEIIGQNGIRTQQQQSTIVRNLLDSTSLSNTNTNTNTDAALAPSNKITTHIITRTPEKTTGVGKESAIESAFRRCRQLTYRLFAPCQLINNSSAFMSSAQYMLPTITTSISPPHTGPLGFTVGRASIGLASLRVGGASSNDVGPNEHNYQPSSEDGTTNNNQAHQERTDYNLSASDLISRHRAIEAEVNAVHLTAAQQQPTTYDVLPLMMTSYNRPMVSNQVSSSGKYEEFESVESIKKRLQVYVTSNAMNVLSAETFIVRLTNSHSSLTTAIDNCLTNTHQLLTGQSAPGRGAWVAVYLLYCDAADNRLANDYYLMANTRAALAATAANDTDDDTDDADVTTCYNEEHLEANETKLDKIKNITRDSSQVNSSIIHRRKEQTNEPTTMDYMRDYFSSNDYKPYVRKTPLPTSPDDIELDANGEVRILDSGNSSHTNGAGHLLNNLHADPYSMNNNQRGSDSNRDQCNVI